MKYGFILPRGDASTAAEFARQAEQAGWDGFFVWEPVWGIDAWVSLTAAAMVTQRIRLGTMLSAISRMRPWKLASETATLDNLSGGRVILSVGLGAIDTGFIEFGEATDRKTRAELVDEGLDILTGLWKGQPFSYNGKHYQVKPFQFPHLPPPPVQKPRIPIWVVGAWPRPKSMRRVLRCDGLLPAMIGKTGKGEMRRATPDEVRQMKAWIDQNRTGTTPFDIIVEGRTPGDKPDQAVDIIRPYAEAGATWWLEALWDEPDLELVLARIRQGPSPSLLL
jgi:alkanesulfonate monooxygenase SsuD/methylene tetrahydromethanopterin reductase-like flavin-dependent oxidoreductase (luciferase family)